MYMHNGPSYSPVKYFFCFTRDSRTVASDVSTGGTSIIAFQLLSVRSKVVASVTPATFLFDRDALTAHLCFNRSYILSYILVVWGSVFCWGSSRLAQTETDELFMWKVGAMWDVQWVYSELMAYILFRLWTQAFWNFLMMEFVFQILLIMCISGELLIILDNWHYLIVLIRAEDWGQCFCHDLAIWLFGLLNSIGQRAGRYTMCPVWAAGLIRNWLGA